MDRLRGASWQRIRAKILAASPMCVSCLARGFVIAATEIDHIKALKDGGTNAAANLQPLCGECHLEKTRTDMGWRRRPKIGRDGWPSDM
jgi:5-methylcytosine-specific restriction protein A